MIPSPLALPLGCARSARHTGVRRGGAELHDEADEDVVVRVVVLRPDPVSGVLADAGVGLAEHEAPDVVLAVAAVERAVAPAGVLEAGVHLAVVPPGVIEFLGGPAIGGGDAVARGARVELGGNAWDNYVEPTVLTNVDASMDIWNDETFGPVRSH